MLLALIDKLFSGIVSMLPSSIVERYPQDKIKHVIAGVIVGVASGAVAYHLGMTMLWAVYSTAIVGAAKEAYDAITNAIAASKTNQNLTGSIC